MGTAHANPSRFRGPRATSNTKKATVSFWPKGKEAEKRSVETSGTTAKLENLYRNTEYEYQLSVDTSETWKSEVKSFKTADYTRMIHMGAVHNVRDLGGYMTSDGKRTKQGLIYRGYEVMGKAVGQHSANYTAEVQKVQDEVLHIGYEIDLKEPSATEGLTASHLTPAKYENLEGAAYEGFIHSPKTENVKKTFEILANADKEHVYFHCWGGADRTGMIAFFVNAICGVSYTDLVMDFEYMTLTNNKRCHMHNSSNARFPKFLDAFAKWSGYDANKTVNVNAEAFLVSLGVPATTIEEIRSIMIEDDASTLKENEDLETYKTAWVSDDEGHWHESEKAGSKRKGDYHKHAFLVVEAESTEANCAHAGKEVKVCADCGKRAEVVTPKTDHTFKGNGDAGGVVHPELDNGCNTKAYRLDIAEAAGWNESKTKWNAKTAPTNEAKWDIEGKIPAGKYQVALEGVMSFAFHSDRYFYNQHETDTSSQPDIAEQDPFRYFFKVDGGAAINPDTKKSWGELGYGADKNNPTFATIVSEFALPEGAKSFSAFHGNIGYSMIVSRIRLIEVKSGHPPLQSPSRKSGGLFYI